MKQKLTDRQIDLSIAIREIVNIPDGESWGAFTDFTRAIATMIEGVENLAHPIDMQKRFAVAWDCYAVKIWAGEHNRIIRECLGGKEEFERVKSHPNGRNAFKRILSRVKEVHGDLIPGMNVEVEVGDILVDEMTEIDTTDIDNNGDLV